MNFTPVAYLVASFLFFIVLIFLGGMMIFKLKRRQIIRLGHEATGTILEIKEHWGRSGNKYFKLLIQYQTRAGQTVMFRHTTINKRETYQIGETVSFYYNPRHPEKYLFKNDKHGKSVMRFFCIMASLFIILAVCALFLLS